MKRGKEEGGLGKEAYRKDAKPGQQKCLREVRGSQALEVVDKNLSLEGNIVLQPQNDWGEN